MKEKIINYIEVLEAKSLQVDDYFKQRNDLYIENQNKDKEIERLNNIINELEKTLLEWHEYWEDDVSYSWQYKNAYDYLQELKGSVK